MFIINQIINHIINRFINQIINKFINHFKEIDGPVMDEVAAPFEPTLIYSLRKTAYLNIDT